MFRVSALCPLCLPPLWPCDFFTLFAGKGEKGATYNDHLLTLVALSPYAPVCALPYLDFKLQLNVKFVFDSLADRLD